ncbi:MAG: type II toxin-antitoxin system RelE/ParE family toxin [Acholeplasmatales bacterium]|nr:type II toxin-antitoxin system RelE/ParE family toxin [Acholeplasmatales bacterium]
MKRAFYERIEEEYDIALAEKALKEYKKNPKIHGKPLIANRSGQWRYRIGDYRIIALIEDEKLIILVISVGHRRDIKNIFMKKFKGY